MSAARMLISGAMLAELADQADMAAPADAPEDTTIWLDAEPGRPFADRARAAFEALGHDLSHLSVIPVAEVERFLADDEFWDRSWGRCGGPAGQRALADLLRRPH